MTYHIGISDSQYLYLIGETLTGVDTGETLSELQMELPQVASGKWQVLVARRRAQFLAAV